MVAKLVTFFALVAAVSAVAVPGIPIAKVAYAEPEAPAHYQYTYSVQDSHTGDIKQQQEARDGDIVQGSYSLLQPDGITRIVEYSSDAVHGFNANVRYEGAPVQKIAVAAPIAKVAYAPAPVAKIAYAPAPVAKVAYAAPVAKVAYASAPAAYAPAPISYAPAPVTYAQAPAYAPAPVAYASAPVAKVAYAAAPVSKYAYTENLGHVSFNSPVVSYHH